MEFPRSGGDRPRWLVPLVVVAVAVCSWIAAGLRPFTTAAEVMVAIPAIVVFAAAWRPTREPPAVRWSRGSVALWLGLVVLAVGWEFLAYFSSPREDHPTLSVIARRDHERAPRARVAVPALAHARLDAGQEPRATRS